MEPVEDIFDDEVGVGDTIDENVARLFDVFRQICDREDALQILSKIEDPEGVADELESALNTAEAED